jgi:hypothetical protein
MGNLQGTQTMTTEKKQVAGKKRRVKPPHWWLLGPGHPNRHPTAAPLP